VIDDRHSRQQGGAGREEERGEMRTSVKTPIIILSALALLAGCKSEPPKTGLETGPKTGYLRLDDDMVMFIELTQAGRKIEGTIEEWIRTPHGKVEFTMHQFYGVLDGEKVSMTLNFSGTLDGGFTDRGGTIAGVLRGDTLAWIPGLQFEPVLFHRASSTEYVDAYRNLYMRATKKETAKKSIK
jgi:hypothetical protein